MQEQQQQKQHVARLAEIGLPRPVLKQAQMRATGDPVTFFTFMPHQTRLVRRLAEKCRRQHGILLIHSMGSGKTISSLGVWLNFPRPEGSGASVTNRLVIVTPPGLDSAFREDLEDMGFPKRFIDQQVREQRIVFIDYDDIEFGRRQADGTRMGMAETMQFIASMLKDAFIIADEAHNFVAILKKWARQEKIDLYTVLLDAFNDAKKVVLLSGTPLQREWNDLTILASLAAGYKAPDIERKLPVYPTYQSQINITYPVDFTRSLWLRQKFLEDPRVLATGLATIGVAAGLFLAPPAIVVTSLVGGAMSLYGLYQATAGTSKVIGSLVEGTLAGVSATVSSFVGDVPRFSVQKMGEDISKHVSYFNYTDLDFHLTETFPLKQVITLPNRYSPFQLDMLIKQSRLEDVLDDLELEFTDRKSFATDAFKLGESVKVKSADNMEHYRRMRVLGNLSEDNYYYVTVRAQKPDAFGNRVYYVFPRYEDEARQDVTDFSSGFSSDGVVRTAVNVAVPSEEYKRALQRYDDSYVAYKYNQYRSRIGGHKDKVARNAAAGNEIAEVQKQIDEIAASVGAKAAPSAAQQEKMDSLKKQIESIERASKFDPTDLSVFRLHNVEIVRAKRSANMTFATNKFLSALHTLCEERTKYHYLPLFYSNFDEYGFRLFSAFLTQRGYYHILIDPFDDPDVRQQLIKLGNLPYRRFKRAPSSTGTQGEQEDALRYVPMSYDEETPEVVKRLNLDRNKGRGGGGVGADVAPLCVLLHPAIVEGLSFNLSPSIVVNEPIDGYGRAEQLYARILRAIRGTNPYDFGKDQKRLTKKVVADALKKDDKTLFADILREKQPNVADERVDELFAQSKKEIDDVPAAEFGAFLTSKFPQYLSEQSGALDEADGARIRERSHFFQYLLAGLLHKQIENLGNKPPKTTAECVSEGFYEETDIPKDFPRMIVRENILYQTLSKQQSKEARDEKGRYTIELLDNSIGYIDEQDYCSKKNNQYCRSPVYVELKDDYRLKRCKKKVFLQQSTFGKWKVFSKERLQQLGSDFGIEPLKTAVDVEVSAFELPPVLSLVEPYLAGLGKYVPSISAKEGELERAQRKIAASAPGTGIAAESMTLAKMQMLRYFRDDTYPGGFWNISDPTRTNELNGTETPDEIVEKNNRVNMFNWMLLADVLRQKFEEDETSICDAKCVGQCLWRQPDEGRCLPWLQENVARETPSLGSEPGTCFKQSRLDRSVSKDSMPEMYQYIEHSDRAYAKWKKYRDALRATSDPAKRRQLIETFQEKFDVGEVAKKEKGKAGEAAEKKRQESWSSYLLGMVGLAGSPQNAATPFLMDEENRAKSGIEPMV